MEIGKSPGETGCKHSVLEQETVRRSSVVFTRHVDSKRGPRILSELLNKQHGDVESTAIREECYKRPRALLLSVIKFEQVH